MRDMLTPSMPDVTNNDAELVAASLSGDRTAFGQIVSRYQSLICSLAYSATGSLGQSEDLAQETFITAWKHLCHLREQNKLRAWLCGIARNRINSALRRDGREPVRSAEPLDVIHESASSEPLPHDQTISREEEAILWRSLERIPDIYREPLVLFYREHQSVENVALALDLSEDAVKQRLSRGRKLLAEEVAAFVEGTLARTNPGKAFTIGVIAALPLVLTSSAKAATLGAAAAKGSSAAKLASVAGFFNAIIGPILGFLGPWLQYRIAMESARSDAESAFIRRYFHRMFAVMLSFVIALLALFFLGSGIIRTHTGWFVGALLGLIGIYVVIGISFAAWSKWAFKAFRQEADAKGENYSRQAFWEFRSRTELLGMPLIHIRLGKPSPNWSPVKAWIAAGDFAYGGLFALGGVAIAPVCVGGLAIGLISWGGVALGAFVLGGLAFGGWAFGGMAIGWQAFGGCAVAWNAAMGGLAVAREFAVGGVAHAAQSNNEIATQFMKSQFFFVQMEALARYINWLNLLWLIPMVAWQRAVRRKNCRALA